MTSYADTCFGNIPLKEKMSRLENLIFTAYDLRKILTVSVE